MKETLRQAEPEVDGTKNWQKSLFSDIKKIRRLFWSTEAPKKPVVTEEQEEEMEYSYGKEDSAVCDHCTSDEQGFHW
ncbi:hypothetical protein DPMN_177422 [Dreissena polymorpha]|uniref:Uncharacterized protein n=1 Tax=Dreissena polymorpha TaxID=45954 RepID=A0A9D4EA76_DREPO|nr:hypothetical protein DPMN_177422 [Dreissena polymorpha]